MLYTNAVSRDRVIVIQYDDKDNNDEIIIAVPPYTSLQYNNDDNDKFITITLKLLSLY